jgi:hypothetical protein
MQHLQVGLQVTIMASIEPATYPNTFAVNQCTDGQTSSLEKRFAQAHTKGSNVEKQVNKLGI